MGKRTLGLRHFEILPYFLLNCVSQIRKYFSIFIIVLVGVGAMKMLLLSAPYLTMERDTDFLVTKRFYYDLPEWKLSFYIHVFSSWALLFTGVTQFIPALHRRWPVVHKCCGYIYVGILLLFSGPAALVMGIHANGGLASKASFILLGTLWWVFTTIALYLALKKKWQWHAAFMLRSFALCISALTLRLYAMLLSVFEVGFDSRDKYTLIAWLSWVPNLLIAEWLIQNGFAKRLVKRVFKTT
jgi:hypothetical protein